MPALLPPSDKLHIVFAHAAYQGGACLAGRQSGIAFTEVRDLAGFEQAIGAADIAVVSGLWRNSLLDKAPKLTFVQSISAGVDQFDRAAFQARGVRLASAQGANERAVAEHAIALTLALTRKLHTGRDLQRAHVWRGMIGDPATREDELGGKTMVVVGLGRIGSRVARLAKAFDMTVIGIKRDPAVGAEAADAAYRFDTLAAVVPNADIVVLTCPLTPQTTGLIDATVLGRMKPGALLINVARGKVVDEPALIAALTAGVIAGAGLDCTAEEPLPAQSPLWDMEQVLITPHTAGETRRYEDNLIDLLLENIARLQRGEATLVNQIV
jgi:phosphoglycerate dehydrogenase-like enzyme